MHSGRLHPPRAWCPTRGWRAVHPLPMLPVRQAPQTCPRRSAAAAASEASAPPSTVHSRREALALLPSLALLAGCCPPRPAHAAAAAEADGSIDPSFYSQWPYISPADILPYLKATAKQGDPESVLAAIDNFAKYYPMYRSGPEKGRVLEELVSAESPSLVLELGTFMGYGTIRIARALPPGGRVVSIEASPEQAEVAREVLSLAGFADPSRVQVLAGLSSDVLPRLAEELPAGPARSAGVVFLDHCKPCYRPDLQAMESLGLVGDGSLVIADNVVYPGTPDYLAHVQAPGSAPFDAMDSSSSSRGAGGRVGRGKSAPAAQPPAQRFLYDTRLVEAAFEVEQKYKAGWEPQADALAVSRCLGPAPDEQ